MINLKNECRKKDESILDKFMEEKIEEFQENFVAEHQGTIKSKVVDATCEVIKIIASDKFKTY